MPPNQQQSAVKEAWPTQPGSTSAHIQIPPAPSMAEIQDAMNQPAICVLEVDNNDNNQQQEGVVIPSSTAGVACAAGAAVAIAETTGVEFPDVLAKSTKQTPSYALQQPVAYAAGAFAQGTTTIINQQTTDQQQAQEVALPVQFMGYMDEKGIIHKDKFDSSLNLIQYEEEEEKKAASISTKAKAMATAVQEEEKQEIPASAEDVLQASLNFERSHPEKRFSSSLDQYYYSRASIRNLYPSLEDVSTAPPPAQMMSQEISTRQESVDSVRTTCADVVASAASVAAAAAKAGRSGAAGVGVVDVVPEPPGETETTYAIASATYHHEAEEEEDVKIGVARAELDRADTDSPAYATVASVQDSNAMAHYASAEATVLATSETDEEALLAKLAAEDAELLALKRSAYGGGYEGTPGYQAQPAALVDQQATVVSITEHDVHPSELSHGAVRAELIGEDYNDVPPIGSPSTVAVAAAAASSAVASACAGSSSHVNVASLSSSCSPPPSSSQAVYAVEEAGYAVIDSEATIIGGGSTWQAEEATVLNEDSAVPYSDRKLPAVATDQQSTPQRNNRFADYSFGVPAAAAAASGAVAQGEAEVITVSDDPYFESTSAASAAYGNVAHVDEGTSYGTASNVAYASAEGAAISSVAYAEGGADYGTASGVAYASADEGAFSSVAYPDGSTNYAAASGVAYATADGAVSSVAYADGAADYGAASSVAYASTDAISSAAYGDGGTNYGTESSVAHASADGTVSSVAYADGASPYGSASGVAYADSSADYGNTVAYTEDAVSSVACGDASDYGNASTVAYAGETAAYANASSVAYAAAPGDQAAEVVGITEEYHPAEVSGTEAQAELVTQDYGAAMAYPTDGDQAEVVGITEEFHPAEVSGNEAQAELVAEEYGAVVLPAAEGGDQAEVVEITEEYHPAEVSGGEAQAELVGEDYGTAVAQPSSVGVEATALPADGGDAVQAATVVGYEDEGDLFSSPGMSRASSYGGTPVPDRTPPSARAYTAPAAVGTRIDPVGTPLTQATAELDTVVEEDWMRTPSVTGDSLTPMKPPMDGEDERPAVAVASLEAYAEAPVPRVDDASCCSPAGYSQPAVAVASLNAYASAPAPSTFDDTDCSMVNRQAVQPEIVGQASNVIDASESSLPPVEPPTMPPPRSFNSTGQSSEGGSVSSAASVSTSTTGRGFQKISNGFARGMEMLFGDSKPTTGRGRSQALNDSSLLKSVLSRQLLPWSVIYSEATNMWVATVNTNQKALDSKNVVEASKSLRAFSVVTEKQATCLAKAWSPPRMHDFKKNNACHICKAKFAVFRRACHCRNCGVAICVSSNGCSRPWPAKMCPETYNIKKESFLNVCAACDFLCTSFRLALLEGNRDKAIALHATGNINIVTPFANVKGELFYPVHCAALGGNLELLKWLVDENCCPIKSVRVSGRCRDSSNSFTEISTSKGRSLLGIALENRNVGIVRYLVVDKGIQLSGEKDITMDTLCRNLELVLRLLPEDAATGNTSDPAIAPAPSEQQQHVVIPGEQAPPCDDDGNANVRGMDTGSDGSVSDACIICFDRSIDCVATPCGHQVCCLDCSKNITRCPVCAVECSFMRVFRP